jgi:cholinesterase
MIILFIIFAFFSAFIAQTNCYQNEYTIKIKLRNNQILIGNRLKLNGSIVYEFLGIPYAQAPLKEYRFRFPVKLNQTLPYSPYNATNNRASCPQFKDELFKGFHGSEMWNAPDDTNEDCLFMNIWIPINKEFDNILMPQSELLDNQMLYLNRSLFLSENSSLSTMFWIYGGSFTSGSISLKIYNGSALAAYQNVAVVSCNYRLGALGFLYLNNSDIPGNAALADQILALEWYLSNYAEHFGASSENITLFGESAGSMSIHYHLLGSKKNLFKNAILQSASALVRINKQTIAYKSPKDALKATLKLAKLVNCTQELNDFDFSFNIERFDTFDLTKCLQEVDVKKLLDAQLQLDDMNVYLQIPFTPTLDYNKYISVSPFDTSTYSTNHNILVGANDDEGSYFLFYSFVKKYFDLNRFYYENLTYNDSFVTTILNKILSKTNSNTENNLLLTTNCLSEFYSTTENATSQEEAWIKISRIIGDIIFACPVIKLGSYYESSVYYKFSHRSLNNPWPSWMGVMHGYEIEFIFGLPVLEFDSYTDEDRLVSQEMMFQWAYFAKHGFVLKQSTNSSNKIKFSNLQYSNLCSLYDYESQITIEFKCRILTKTKAEVYTSGLSNQKLLSILSLACNIFIIKINFVF